MRFENLPDNIKEAIRNDDKEALSRAGKKGAKVSAENRKIRKEEQKEFDAKYATEHNYRKIFHRDGEEAAEEYLKKLEKNN